MKNLRWVVQKDLWNEKGYHALLDTLNERGIPHDIVKVIPFSHHFTPELHPDSPVVVMGWEGFGIRARELGWRPGAYLSSNLDQRIWLEAWGHLCLNADSEIGRLGDAPEDRGEVFLRPVLDDKSFAGRLDTPESLAQWKADLTRVVAGMLPDESEPTVTVETIVSWSSPKRILAEYRFFLVGRTVVTGSRYQMAGRSANRLVVDPDALPDGVGAAAWTCAQAAADLWSPLDNFVLDVAETDEGLRIIECGCLNAAGWYDSDVARIVDAVEQYERTERSSTGVAR
jgi:hypothetical protein